MPREFPSPTIAIESRREVLYGYVDYFRGVLVDKVADLDERQARQVLVPSGWSPIELVQHLRHVERRWLEWGFEGTAMPDPWGDQRDGRWHVDPGLTLAEVVDGLTTQAQRSAEIVAAHELDEIGQPGERWDGADPATLERVLLHLIQEYARHLGHLDIVRELIDGQVGE